MTDTTLKETFVYTDYFTSTSSSLIAGVYYSEVTRQLLVIFVNGHERIYYGVERDCYYDFWNAHSAGWFYNARIKGAYRTRTPGSGVTLVQAEPECNPSPALVCSGPTYTVRGSIEFTHEFPSANSLDEAVRMVKEFYPTAEVTVREVVAHFNGSN